MDKALSTVTASCHSCASLQRTPKIPISQSTSDPPAGIGLSFAADVCKRNRQSILAVLESVTSCTMSKILPTEMHEDLRDALIFLCCELKPLDGPLAVIRVDPAPGFQALIDDPILRKCHITIEIGWIRMSTTIPLQRKPYKNWKLNLFSRSHTTTSLPRGPWP